MNDVVAVTNALKLSLDALSHAYKDELLALQQEIAQAKKKQSDDRDAAKIASLQQSLSL